MMTSRKVIITLSLLAAFTGIWACSTPAPVRAPSSFVSATASTAPASSEPLGVFGTPAPLQVKARFVGAETCRGCHTDIYNVWATTSHHIPRSTAPGSDWTVKTTSVPAGSVVIGANGNLPIPASLAPRLWMASGYIVNPVVSPVPTDINRTAACVACHVVGQAASSQDVWSDTMFRNTRGAGKLNSIMVDGLPAGYDFSKAFNDPANSKFVGIQCESCHGPGSAHIGLGVSTAERLDAIVQKPDWQTSCRNCHSPNFMVNFADSATDADVNVNPAGFSPHAAQSIVFGNNGGYEYNDQFGPIPRSAHQTRTRNGCIDCHFVGPTPNNHQVVVEYNVPGSAGYNPAFWSADNWELHLQKCQTCHGASFSQANVEAFQSQTRALRQTLHDALSSYQRAFCKEYYFQTSSNKWPPVVMPSAPASQLIGNLEVTGYQCSKWVSAPGETGPTIAAGATSQSVNWLPYVTAKPGFYQTEYDRARWNFNVVNSDASVGVHSPAYVQELVRRSYNQLYTVLGAAGYGTTAKPFPSPYPSVFAAAPSPGASVVGTLSLKDK